MTMEERRIVETDSDAAVTGAGASALTGTIVWSVVVLVLLGIRLYARYNYLHWF